MSIKDRVARKFRQNLNIVLDAVQDFEAMGGIRGVVDPFVKELGFEELGPPPTKSGHKSIADYYANLEVPNGSDLATVKESYRNLMRRYHPDRHVGDPQMESMATELAQELTRAYTVLEEVGAKPNVLYLTKIRNKEVNNA